MVARYSYAPVLQSHNIRLLRLNRRQIQSSPLTGSLILHHLDAADPPYTSLSYSWGRNIDGDASLCRIIFLDGCFLPISENLYDFLVQFSEPEGRDPPLLWVDAICINQEDVDERGRQTSIMATIYQKASDLVIWLGHGRSELEDLEAMEALSVYQDDSIDGASGSINALLKSLTLERTNLPLSRLQTRALATARELAGTSTMSERSRSYKDLFWPGLMRYALAAFGGHEACKRLLQQWDPRELLIVLRFTSAETASRLIEAFGRRFFNALVAVLSKHLGAVKRLCQRRYFARRWVMQEIYQSNPSRMVLHWGAFAIGVHEFSERVRKLDSWLSQGLYNIQDYVDASVARSLVSVEHDTALEVLEVKKLTLSSNIGLQGERLLDCLLRYRHALCADDRDIVFAFLSMAGAQTSLSVDYTLSADQVFTALASALIGEGAIWKVLCISSWQWSRDHRRKTTGLPGSALLPSWVPDFRCALPGGYEGELKFTLPRTRDPHGCSATVLGDGRILQFQARVGGMISFSEPQSHVVKSVIRNVREGDYLCEAMRDGKDTIGFILRADACERGYFVLAGYWRLEDSAVDVLSDYFSRVDAGTILLY